jgi:SAM-dependent methyltransferase
MGKTLEPLPRFGNWVPVKMVAVPGAAALACLGLGFLTWPLFIAAGALALAAGYFAAARRLFSAEGGDVQSKVLDRLMAEIDWEGGGEALDIGCGNGALVIGLARRFPRARVTGTDFWGKAWDYSRGVCEANARLSGVDGRVSFQRSSASRLPFADGRFDLVVSNLTFHEVKDVHDKAACVREALRVLRPGGVFVFQDLFLMRPAYGDPDALRARVGAWAGEEPRLVATNGESFVPRLLKPPFMLGALALLAGRKAAA